LAQWVCFYGDQEDADKGATEHPHVLVIGKALPVPVTQSHPPPVVEYLLDRDLEDNEGQWGPEPQHLERMRDLGILPKWVEEQELCWWDQMLKDQQQGPQSIHSGVSLRRTIRTKRARETNQLQGDYSEMVSTFATSLGAASFGVQSEISSTPVAELKDSYLRGKVQGLGVSEEHASALLDRYKHQGEDRASRLRGYDWLRDSESLARIENSIVTLEVPGVPTYDDALTFGLTSIAHENAASCYLRLAKREELDRWNTEGNLSDHLSGIVSMELDRRTAEDQSAGSSKLLTRQA
jgi:hypothetical protein